ncbi:hypothetical protein SASPL_104990 [Salvia splendens]|uniref:C2 domain-containing protein n=1 Tax=Salvia splendens TaxID=180675 RepID=A0A8X9A9K6_SALSN|nr:uncharacterized protein LOC121769323 [Salvia splendens]KAG6433378.1 hypothetical protein SASPL_104990 [Salvia splendens]
MAPLSKTHQLLEINIISAQDLELVSKSMKTYAMAWMNPKRKLTSRVDDLGKNNPTWNEKFVFRVEEEFLKQDNSAVMIEIYSNSWFRDVLVGTVRCLVGNLIPQTGRSHNGQPYIGMRFVALQIRRPSGRPQGILNIGVALLDSSMRSMPLYTQPAMSAVGYQNLMEDPDALEEYSGDEATLRRSRSGRSEMTGFGNYSPSSSIIIVKPKIETKEASILSITECMVPVETVRKVGKASSVICGAELRDDRRRPVPTKTRASSVVSYSVKSVKKPESTSTKYISTKHVDVKQLTRMYDANDGIEHLPANEKPKDDSGNTTEDPNQPQEQQYISINRGHAGWSDSEVGPSPSEVAAAVMVERRYPLQDDKESSVLDGWSMDESEEGLRSKLERWRMELPPFENAGADYTPSSYKSSTTRDEDKDGMFTCFGNVFGYECQCVCGKPPGDNNQRLTSPESSPDKSSIY